MRVKYEATDREDRVIGIIVRFGTYGRGDHAVVTPIVLINGKELIYGHSALEVISESR